MTIPIECFELIPDFKLSLKIILKTSGLKDRKNHWDCWWILPF